MLKSILLMSSLLLFFISTTIYSMGILAGFTGKTAGRIQSQAEYNAEIRRLTERLNRIAYDTTGEELKKFREEQEEIKKMYAEQLKQERKKETRNRLEDRWTDQKNEPWYRKEECFVLSGTTCTVASGLAAIVAPSSITTGCLMANAFAGSLLCGLGTLMMIERNEFLEKDSQKLKKQAAVKEMK